MTGMHASMNCDEVNLLVTELAVGTLSGSERASALAHLAGCRSCRRELEELAELADQLLLVAPEDEPSPGFETRVMTALAAAGMGEVSQAKVGGVDRGAAPRRRPWRLLAAAAAVVALLGSAATGAWAVRRADHHTLALTHEYVAALQALGGSSLRAAALRSTDGVRVGQVFVYDGSPSWMFVSLDEGASDGDYLVELSGPKAGPWSVPGLRVADHRGAIGRTARGGVRLFTDVVVTDATGRTRYTATLDPSNS